MTIVVHAEQNARKSLHGYRIGCVHDLTYS